MKLQAARERWKKTSFLLIQWPKAHVLQHMDCCTFPQRKGCSLWQLALPLYKQMEWGTSVLANKPQAHTLSFHVRSLHVSFQVVSRSRWGMVIILWWCTLFYVLGSSLSNDEIAYITQHHFQSLFGCQVTIRGHAAQWRPRKPQLTLHQQIGFPRTLRKRLLTWRC